MARKQPNNTGSSSSSSRNVTGQHHQQRQHEDDDSLLSSSCEIGGAVSEDTASLSVTQDGSFLSSFSQDTQEDAVVTDMMLHYWNHQSNNTNTSLNNNNHPLRHRRALHQQDDLQLLKEEGELASYNSEDEKYDPNDNDEVYEYHHHHHHHDPYESENSKNHHTSLRRSIQLEILRRRKLKWLRVLVAVLLSLCAFVCILGVSPVAQLSQQYHLQGRRRWKLPSRKRTRKVLQQLREQPVANGGLTLRVKGKHVDLLHRAVEQYAFCPVVTHIQIDWTCPEERGDMPKSLLSLQHKGKLLPPQQQQQQQQGNDDSSSSDNNNINIPTTAVLLLDEHVVLHCRDIVKVFAEWRQDPSRLVGLVPSHNHAPYSLVSDAAAIVHRFYWRSFQKAASVTGSTSVLPDHCQHVALSAWVTALSHQSPIAMLSNVMLLPDFDESNDDISDKRLSSSSLVNVPDDCYRRAARAAGLSVLPETSGTILGGVTFL